MSRRGTEPAATSFSIFLMKEEIDSSEAALKQVRGEITKHRVAPSSRKVGDLFVQNTPVHPPKWARFFGSDAAPSISAESASNAAVWFVPSRGRLFAVVFGYGRHMLRPGTWEERFGLRVTLNSVAADQIRSIDRRTLDSMPRQVRTQTSRDAALHEFGIDIEQDLLRAVTGTPSDERLGHRMSGMDSLSVTMNLAPEQMPERLGTYLGKFHANDYKDRYPWIDHIGEVHDASLVAELDEELVNRLRANQLARVWLAPYEIVDWARVAGFRYTAGGRELKPDLHLRDFLSTFKDPNEVTSKSLRTRQVSCIEVASELAFDHWPAYHCIYCEIDRDRTTFVLSGGKWFRVDTAFAAGVNRSVAALVAPAPFLPAYADRDEGAYNERVAVESGGRLALCDRRLISLGQGRSSVEFCDLFSRDRHLVHVKRYHNGPGALSHLFAQGAVSASMLARDEDFRESVRNILPSPHATLIPKGRPDCSRFHVVFAIASTSASPIDRSLPFFSRLNLKNQARMLKDTHGFLVSLARIAA